MEQLGDDLLLGAEAISTFLFGTPKKRRKIYHLQKRLPLFHMGNELAGRKSTLAKFVSDQEAASNVLAGTGGK